MRDGDFPFGEWLRDFYHLPLKDDVPVRDLWIDRHDRIHGCPILECDGEERIAHLYGMRFCTSSSTWSILRLR